MHPHDEKNLSDPKMTACVIFKSFKCEIFLWLLLPWKQVQGQTYAMQWKVLSLYILGIDIKSVPQKVTVSWAFIYYLS